MDFKTKAKEWMQENVPMLTKLYDNKYVSMAYDRYASLPPNQQKQVTLGLMGLGIFLVVGYLFSSYMSLWSRSQEIQDSEAMVSLIQEHEKQNRNKSSQMGLLELGNRLNSRGALKQFLLQQGRLSNISPRLLKIEESESLPGNPKGKQEPRLKRATVNLQRVNLSQFKSFLEKVEFNEYNLSISSLKIVNDDKIRGYMNIEMGIVAYIFQSGASS